ncbi:hypothetical protein, partial [Enterobacter hormaechei]|uniref:hypothetical protein n=1 Tax=Enterobacter hormaechei TaxID=158836 RepID=UPI00203E7C43
DLLRRVLCGRGGGRGAGQGQQQGQGGEHRGAGRTVGPGVSVAEVTNSWLTVPAKALLTTGCIVALPGWSGHEHEQENPHVEVTHPRHCCPAGRRAGRTG